MIDITHLDFKYRKQRECLLEDLSLQAVSGKIYGLLGKNGCGKSTLLYLIAGLLKPNKGSLSIDEELPTKRTTTFLQNLFLVPEEIALPAIKADSYIALNAPLYPNFSQDILESCLTAFEMDTDRRLDQLSMGQQKKFYLSFALATRTKHILMDEPTNGLDIPSKSQFRKVITQHLDESQTVIISTHQIRDIDILLDAIIVVDRHKIVVNTDISTIQNHFCFTHRPSDEPVDDALFVQPTIGGNAVMLSNDTAEETQVNVELFFNAVTSNPQLIVGKL
ncbi:ABC transporter ATP-binding protein [Alloprevotella tannerae]|uniref:ABC transporter ATP-binding protein n=1 Tax=Alloprevotella tannerae TaxID=76122 RepID=UPI001EDC5636|nr:ABC transporter ATP-binding protein [Alloprevotella tannerae]MCG2650462.1 ABC transporter ATP-binding protein [Alloprevotella tannerae]